MRDGELYEAVKYIIAAQLRWGAEITLDDLRDINETGGWTVELGRGDHWLRVENVHFADAVLPQLLADAKAVV